MKSNQLVKQEDIEAVIRKCNVCHIGMIDTEGQPYVLPMNFGYDNGVIYLHSSQKGKKITILTNNPQVCIEFSTDYLLRFQSEEMACSYSMKYRSVLAYGKVEFVEDPEEKIPHLNIIMKNYTPREFTYGLPSLKEVCCWKVKVEKFEGKVFGY
ncbi:MAG: pyridoxamine 5'-phosphate oxidase family protein [Bacteroidetes bacterium]|nr:pyridoxamine 5'-phosphate oxidase family protein [Bacteroidota bacterium]